MFSNGALFMGEPITRNLTSCDPELKQWVIRVHNTQLDLLYNLCAHLINYFS